LKGGRGNAQETPFVAKGDLLASKEKRVITLRGR